MAFLSRLDLCGNRFAGILATLKRPLRDRRYWLTGPCIDSMCRVAHNEDVRMPRDGEIFPDDHPTGAIELGAERRSGVTCFERRPSVIVELLKLVEHPAGEGSLANGGFRVAEDVPGEACDRHTVCRKALSGALFTRR